MSATVLICAVSACSGDNDSAEEPSLTASQVCDSTLDSSASTALQRVGNVAKFTELPGTNDSGEPNTFSLKRSASTIHEDQTQRNQCVVFKAGDKTGHPLIAVDFSAEKYATTPDPSAEDDDSALYSMGVYAKSNGNSSAILYFKCPTQGTEEPKNSTPYIKASLTSAGQLSIKTTGRDLMAILNAVSRGLAKQLGCTSEAALPAQVPEAKVG
ncbi:hypothetical protein ABZ464_18660 [Streptomyces sp. NPDC005820]|uniref:hypothetical protein n=1 Tax=Streptomyces sp. NPDC005820 TaxID=3157069 RepID=UPI0033CF266F